MTDATDDDAIAASVRCWVKTIVVGLDLCPFAAKELRRERIRFTVSTATTETQLQSDLQTELKWLDVHSTVETTLLIHPWVLQDFDDYNQFLKTADDLLVAMEAEGTYQVASFHPRYQFADTADDDVENYTNRSPYPMLHLLREQSLERAIDGHPDTTQIPQRNIERMKRLGIDKLKRLLQDC